MLQGTNSSDTPKKRRNSIRIRKRAVLTIDGSIGVDEITQSGVEIISCVGSAGLAAWWVECDQLGGSAYNGDVIEDGGEDAADEIRDWRDVVHRIPPKHIDLS
jgi:hypothetical protein